MSLLGVFIPERNTHSGRPFVHVKCKRGTTLIVVFLAARISYIRFFTAVQIYEFHISKIIIHHLDGIFGPNILISSQLVKRCTGIAEVMGSNPVQA